MLFSEPDLLRATLILNEVFKLDLLDVVFIVYSFIDHLHQWVVDRLRLRRLRLWKLFFSWLGYLWAYRSFGGWIECLVNLVIFIIFFQSLIESIFVELSLDDRLKLFDVGSLTFRYDTLVMQWRHIRRVHLLLDLLCAPNQQIDSFELLAMWLIFVNLLLDLQAFLKVAQCKPYLEALLERNLA